jgi:hypothetical protein
MKIRMLLFDESTGGAMPFDFDDDEQEDRSYYDRTDMPQRTSDHVPCFPNLRIMEIPHAGECKIGRTW